MLSYASKITLLNYIINNIKYIVSITVLHRIIEVPFAVVRMAERSKALRSGRSLVFQAWVRIPLLT